jgi:hypothetical protein
MASELPEDAMFPAKSRDLNPISLDHAASRRRAAQSMHVAAISAARPPWTYFPRPK